MSQRCIRAIATSTLAALAATSAVAGTYTEDFTTTAFRDSANTTADWNALDGELKLFTFSPTLVGTFNTTGAARAVAVDGDFAFVADQSSGLQVIDISDPANPSLLGTFDTAGFALGVAVEGDLVFVADSNNGLLIFDISDPTSPTQIGSFDTPGFASDVAVSGDHAYVADYNGDLQVIDVSNPALPALVGTFTTLGNVDAVEVDGNFAFLADENFGLYVVDVSDPTSPVFSAFIDTPGSAVGIAVDGDFAFIADGATGLLIFDITDPTGPTQVGSYNTPGFAYEVSVDGDRAFVADKFSGLQVIDISDPTAPSLAGSYDTPSEARDVAVDGIYAFVADELSGLQVVQVSLPLAPAFTGSLSMAGDAKGIVVAGNFAYVVTLGSTDAMHVVDISDPSNPTPVGSTSLSVDANGIAVSGNYAFVAINTGLQVIDISNPTTPTTVASYSTASAAADVDVSGDHAYVAATGAGLEIVDISDPTAPTLVTTLVSTGNARDVVVKGNHAYVAANDALVVVDIETPSTPALIGNLALGLGATVYGVAVAGDLAFAAASGVALHVIDVSDPTTPTLRGTFDTTGGFATHVDVVGDMAFVGDCSNGLHIVDITDPTAPALVWTYDTPGCADELMVAGHFAYSADRAGGLQIVRIAQDEAFVEGNVGRSVPVDGADDTIVRARITSTETAGVAWELDSFGGSVFQQFTPGSWAKFDSVSASATDLVWRSTHTWAPGLNPTVSALTVDWRNEFGPISSITDVPDDQGGRVYLQFTRSGYDFADEVDSPVSGYNIYRRIDDAPLALEGTEVLTGGEIIRTPDGRQAFAPGGSRILRSGNQAYFSAASGTFPPGTWALVGTAFATQSDSYLIEVTTDGDSTQAGIDWSTYLVTAHTTTPSVWFASAPDSGYSVDNIAPGVPSGLVASFSAGTVDLSWDPAPEPDFQYFRVYRSSDPAFVPGPGTLLHETVSSAYEDTLPGAGTAHYKVTALDFAGNESDPAATSATVSVGAPSNLPSTFALYAPRPNPFTAATRLAFDLPRSSHVTLEVFDVRGRRVRVLHEGVLEAGSHSARWDGTDAHGTRLAPGLYLYRVRAGGFESVRRVALLP